MSKVLDFLNSPAWWLSVVVVGILINLIAAYAKPVIDRAFSILSVSWKMRSQRQQQARMEKINDLRKDVHAQILFAVEELRLRQQITLYLIFSGFWLVGIVWLTTSEYQYLTKWAAGFFCINIILAFRYLIRATDLQDLLIQARDTEKPEIPSQ